MKPEELLFTINAFGKEIKIGDDDYGQCYFFEYTNDDGTIYEDSCGTYNTDFLEYIYWHFDKIGTEISMHGLEAFNKHTDFLVENNQTRLEKAKREGDEKWAKYIEDLFEKNIKPRLNIEEKGYNTYDFEAMYKELAEQNKER